jgi:hypothetical protein
MKSEWVALLLVLALCAGAYPATIYVDDNAPGDLGPSDPNVGDPQEDGSSQHPFDSVQEAIDAAANGDTIIVAPGHYLSPDPWAYAELKFKGKSIRLVSSAPTSLSMAERTVLGGVVIFQGNEDPNCLLKGFKIQNHDCGGILGNKTQATISHCIISGNGPCGATVLKDVRGRIANCLIVDNTTFHDCGVLPVVSGCRELVNCTVANNLSGVEITNDGLPSGSLITLRNCILYGNQGSFQLIERWNQTLPRGAQIDYCLIGDWSPAERSGISVWPRETMLSSDPCFVRLGYWQDAPAPPRGRESVPLQARKKILVEGDYHLQSAGWRWSPQPVHGSHWYFDPSTSPAIDAGDPMDSLGEELERGPDDPEGQWGVNHAIDLGAYGGTTQASLAPTEGEPPGVGAVDLRDYWPLTAGDFNQWLVHNPEGIAWGLTVTGQLLGPGGAVCTLTSRNAPDWAARLYYCLYVARTLYVTADVRTLHLPVEVPQQIQAQYPQFLGLGATIEVPYNPFAQGGVQYRTVLVARGTLAEVLAGTSMEPTQFLAGAWPDVIALREVKADGTTGDPIAIFARGFGPLLIAGQPVEQAGVDGKRFGAGTVPSGTRPATRG